jgi:alpha-beta hydrolase superfamily lysophospholipase
MGRRTATSIAVPLSVAAGMAVAGVAAYALSTALVARHVVTPTKRRRADVHIVEVAPDLSAARLGGPADALHVPGRYGLWFDGERGYARLGDILADHSDGTVTRVVETVDWGDLARARTGRLSSWYYPTPESLGLPVHAVEVPVSVGTAPAWLFPAEDETDRWAIHVHGRGTRRQETLRGIPVFHEAGFTSLVVSYRNDGDAPAGPDGRYGLGSTEWRDLDAALGYALNHGARRIVLVGWSMGGAIALQAAVRSPRADSVGGIMLESPVIDWNETLEYQAAEMHLPRPVTRGAVTLLDSSWANRVVGQNAPIGLDSLDFTARAHELEVPVLLLHSDDDGYVPAGASHRLADLRKDIVTFVAFSEAKHTKLWNRDPGSWTSAIQEWLVTLEPDLVLDAPEHGRHSADS